MNIELYREWNSSSSNFLTTSYAFYIQFTIGCSTLILYIYIYIWKSLPSWGIATWNKLNSTAEKWTRMNWRELNKRKHKIIGAQVHCGALSLEPKAADRSIVWKTAGGETISQWEVFFFILHSAIETLKKCSQTINATLVCLLACKVTEKCFYVKI